MNTFSFSANMGFLWTELAFLDRIRQAADNGFAAVEFHDEAQGCDRAALKQTLAATGLPVVGLNVANGGTNGCAAIAEQADRARRDIADAIEVAEDIGAGAVHVMAGLIEDTPGSRQAYKDALGYALGRTDRVILIEPLSRMAAPGYFLSTVDQAAGVIAEIGNPQLKILFDCFHVHNEGGDVAGQFRRHADLVGHVQIASAPDRNEPGSGVLDYEVLLPAFRDAGYRGSIGCEYRPAGTTEDGLGWRDAFAPGG